MCLLITVKHMLKKKLFNQFNGDYVKGKQFQGGINNFGVHSLKARGRVMEWMDITG